MASTEKQMLGTECVRELRARGIDCIICGLSANDLQDAFIKAGADAFLLKPFPCCRDLMEQELARIVNFRSRGLFSIWHVPKYICKTYAMQSHVEQPTPCGQPELDNLMYDSSFIMHISGTHRTSTSLKSGASVWSEHYRRGGCFWGSHVLFKQDCVNGRGSNLFTGKLPHGPAPNFIW